MSISSKGLTKAPGVWPDMHCTLRGTNLHAPQAERLLELPMDITEGALPSSAPGSGLCVSQEPQPSCNERDALLPDVDAACPALHGWQQLSRLAGPGTSSQQPSVPCMQDA